MKIATYIIGSVFTGLILLCLHLFVFLGYNGSLLTTVISFDIAFAGAFLYAIIDKIKSNNDT